MTAFACPKCHQHLTCDDNYAGVEIICPSCNQIMRLPQSAGHSDPEPPRVRDGLWTRLAMANPHELEQLAKLFDLSYDNYASRDALEEALSAAIRDAAGHSIVNLFRKPHDFPYKQILIDVADKLAPGHTFLSWTRYKLDDGSTEEQIEDTIWEFSNDRIRSRIQGLTEAEKQEVRLQTERELHLRGCNRNVLTSVAVGAIGPLSWVAAPLLVWWLGNAAFRKTIPAVIQLIQIRKLRELEKQVGQQSGPLLPQ